MVIKYSFLPNDMLVSSQQFNNFLKDINSLVNELFPRIEKSEYIGNYVVSWIKWIMRTLTGLSSCLLLKDNFPDYAVDILGVRINSVFSHQNIKNLNVLRVSTSDEGFTVVTNITDVKKGEIRAVAVLPPRIFGDIISEAMICSYPLPEEYYGVRPEREKYNFKEVINMIEKYLSKNK